MNRQRHLRTKAMPTSLDDLDHEALHAWLERALRGHECLPRLTPDEAVHLAIVRLERTLRPATRSSLSDACLSLIRQFCANPEVELAHLDELLALAASRSFQRPEAVRMLAELAERFGSDSALPLRRATLASLVDMSPPQAPEFWSRILRQDADEHGLLALSGVLATDPERAVGLLKELPDTERAGRSAALKLDLAWDELEPGRRAGFVEDVRSALSRSGCHFAQPVQAWAESKQSRRPSSSPKRFSFRQGVEEATRRGHKLADDPPHTLSSMSRQTCEDCGRAVLGSPRIAYGSALSTECPARRLRSPE